MAEGSSGEHIQQAYKTFGRGFLECPESIRVYTGEHNEAAETVNHDEQEGIDDPLAKFFNLEDVCYCFKKTFHKALLSDFGCGSALLLDLLDCCSAECICCNVNLCSKFSVGENLDEIVLGCKTGLNQNVRVNC